jgi:hypothetical protein
LACVSALVVVAGVWLVAIGMRQSGWLGWATPALGWILLCSAATVFMIASGISFRLARTFGLRLKPWAREIEDQRITAFRRVPSD